MIKNKEFVGEEQKLFPFSYKIYKERLKTLQIVRLIIKYHSPKALDDVEEEEY